MLTENGVELREWRETDIAQLASLRNDIELQAMLMARARPNTEGRVRAWLEEYSSRDDMVFFVVAATDSDVVHGYIQVAGIDRWSGIGKLGICLGELSQGKNIAAIACRLLEGYLLSTLALRKLILEVLASNGRAVAFYTKSGYRQVGVMKAHFQGGSEFQDVVIMERFLGQ